MERSPPPSSSIRLSLLASKSTFKRTEYPATGGRNFREPALRVTHADGDMNTELRYVSHASKQLSDKNVTETVVKMTDCCQALDVELAPPYSTTVRYALSHHAAFADYACCASYLLPYRRLSVAEAKS